MQIIFNVHNDEHNFKIEADTQQKLIAITFIKGEKKATEVFSKGEILEVVNMLKLATNYMDGVTI